MPYFNTDPIARPNPIDTSSNTIVPVICSYSTTGECKPLYFSYPEKTGEFIRVKIDRVESTKPNSIFGMIYTCIVTIQDTQQKVYLYFLKDFNQWSLRAHG